MIDIKRQFTVYLLTHTASGRGYVGLTSVSLDERLGWHNGAYRTGRTPLYRAMREYGFGAFEASQIAIFSRYRAAAVREGFEIKERGTFYPAGFNVSPSGISRLPPQRDLIETADAQILLPERASADDVRAGLAELVGDNQSLWASAHHIAPSYVCDVLNGRRDPGPALLDLLGIERVVRYRPVKPQET